MKCVVCREREAVLPDRERMGRPVKRICRECHAERLIGDLKHCLDVHNRKKEQRA